MAPLPDTNRVKPIAEGSTCLREAAPAEAGEMLQLQF
jgi:hypothetical protein